MSTTERKGIDMPNNNHDDGITIPTSPVDGLVQRLQEETRERGQMFDALRNYDAAAALDVRAVAIEMVACQATIAPAQTRLFELNKQLLDALLV